MPRPPALLLCFFLLTALPAIEASAQNEEQKWRDFRAELMLAIELNDPEQVRKVLEEGGDGYINLGNPSPLATAVLLDNLNMVALLLRAGGDPNATEDSPLQQALRNDSIDMVRLLFHAGARLPDAEAGAILPVTLRGENALAIYRELLDYGADVDLALRAAVESRKLEAAWLCLERGADVATLGELDILNVVPEEEIPELLALAVRDENREAALSYFLSVAAADGNGELVDRVLAAGGAVSLAHLERAEQQGQDDLALYLLEEHLGGDLPALIEQAEEENRTELAAFLKELRRRRISSVVVPAVAAVAAAFVLVALFLFLKKHILHSPKKLYVAVSRGDLQQVEKLLQAGADANSRHRGEPPLHVAARRDNLTICRLLLRHGAEVDSLSAAKARSPAPPVDAGFAPLHVAARRGSVALAELFLRHGAQVDVRAHSGVTPLYVAASAGRGEMVSLLLERGADPEAVVNQQTLLFVAASNRDLEAAKALLAAGADPNADRGRTALHAAAALGETELVRLLVSRGADVHAVDPDGRTPAALASVHERAEAAQVLQQLAGQEPSAPPAPEPPPAAVAAAAPLSRAPLSRAPLSRAPLSRAPLSRAPRVHSRPQVAPASSPEAAASRSAEPRPAPPQSFVTQPIAPVERPPAAPAPEPPPAPDPEPPAAPDLDQLMVIPLPTLPDASREGKENEADDDTDSGKRA